MAQLPGRGPACPRRGPVPQVSPLAARPPDARLRCRASSKYAYSATRRPPLSVADTPQLRVPFSERYAVPRSTSAKHTWTCGRLQTRRLRRHTPAGREDPLALTSRDKGPQPQRASKRPRCEQRPTQTGNRMAASGSPRPSPSVLERSHGEAGGPARLQSRSRVVRAGTLVTTSQLHLKSSHKIPASK